MKPPLKSIRAFTLVEVVLGLGVIAFCLVTLMGLFATGMLNSKQSSDSTHLAAMSWSIASQMRATNAYYQVQGTVGTPLSGLSATYYYDAAGQATTNQASANTYYTCQVKQINQALPSPQQGTQQMLQLIFTYPPNVSPPPHTVTNYVLLPPS